MFFEAPVLALPRAASILEHRRSYMRRIALLFLGLCLTVGMAGCTDKNAPKTGTTGGTATTPTATDTDKDGTPDDTDTAPNDATKQ
jgi:hypothetical protein